MPGGDAMGNYFQVLKIKQEYYCTNGFAPRYSHEMVIIIFQYKR